MFPSEIIFILVLITLREIFNLFFLEREIIMSYGSKKYRAPNVVFFDLETTGFDRPIRPVQIGAIGIN